MKKRYLIRYNTNSNSQHDRWRILDEEIEYLVSEIRVNVPSFTSTDWIEGIGEKYHIACEGVLKIENNCAIID